MTMPRRYAVLVLLLLASAGVAAPAAAGSALKFTIPEHDLYPENIAHDPVTGDFFLGSMAGSRILRISADGSYGDFLADPDCGLVGSIGLKVDAERRCLWVCSGRFSLHAAYETAPAETGVYRFDLETGEMLERWVLPQPSEYEIFNDLAIAPDGVVYATTTLMGRVYRVTPGAERMEIVHQLPPRSHNNGIACAPDGRLYVTVDRLIKRLDPATGEMTALTAPGDEMRGTDGLYSHDGSLIVVKPRFDAVLKLNLDASGLVITGADTLAAGHPDFAYPTTGVVVGDKLVFVATSFANRPRQAGAAEQHGDVLIHDVGLGD